MSQVIGGGSARLLPEVANLFRETVNYVVYLTRRDVFGEHLEYRSRDLLDVDA